jgi:putative CocE/NonD family hydrolase
MRIDRAIVACLFTTVAFAGCLTDAADEDGAIDQASLAGYSLAPFLNYTSPEPDAALPLVMEDLYLPGTDGVTLHARVARPAGNGPFPIIVQDTPYTGTGCNTATYGAAVEPPVNAGVTCGESTFEYQFARRGYAYVHADLRGTGDSTGCLNLRGPEDIADIGALADGLAAQPWSNGNVGFIGASYPGSTSHMAALAGSSAVKAVIPVVASTSFYHYHHNDGVPYTNHGLGSTNTGYTSEGFTPTANPQSGIAKLMEQPDCPHAENAYEHGGNDQSGAYYGWWQDRNLRAMAQSVDVPVLMAQGLADWNVKPDHIADWFNDLPGANGGAPKVLIAGQWPHAYPRSPSEDCEEYSNNAGRICDPTVPYGPWWDYAAAFFDTYLKEIETGMFQEDTAWVQANDGAWHRSAEWPLQDDRRETMTFTLTADGSMALDASTAEAFEASWFACGGASESKGAAGGSTAEGESSDASECRDETIRTLTFTTPAFEQNVLVSGVPLLRFQADMNGTMRHLTVVMDQLDENGNLASNGTTSSFDGEQNPYIVGARQNYGYLNPEFRDGIENQSPIPKGQFPVEIDMYPQEDFIPAGHSLRITISSTDGGRTIEAFESGFVTLISDPEQFAELELPIRPAHLWGVRLPVTVEPSE